jgi:isoleucyl-tRNA synthetase
MFESVPTDFNFPKSEEKILAFWKENKIFQKSLDLRKNAKPFVFYEGPPTANGLPHPGHVLTRSIKDLFPRYKTMRGYLCNRKAGWDTHGLPVEIEVEKQLGIDGKDQIVNYGVEPFVRKCFDSVFKYVREWEQLTSRIGYWIDMNDPYVTCTTDYVESVWWALSEIFKKGLLYKGYKIVPYCPRCGTVLSSHEVGQGYKDVEEPSIYVAFRTKANPKEYLLAWTTTPWTLISNVALVVKKDYEYAKVKVGDEVMIMASQLVPQVMGKVEHEIVGQVTGADLVGMEYEPLYTYAQLKKKAYYVVEADFVTLDSGSGIVHCAPAFGADDYAVGLKYDLPVVQMVDARGKFKPEVTPWAGKFFKEVDPLVIADLKQRGLLFKRQQYKHSYPFCWRCDTPLIYYAREGWFIRTTEKKDRIIANNQQIGWLPEHIKDGRFGNFLEDNIDWALSRERFWGTPLPIWICENPQCEHMQAFSSKAELLKANPHAFDEFEKRRKEEPELPENMAVHKPFIDQVEVTCPKCGGKMKRTSEVIDCWFDSGCMPFAQWGYPHKNKDIFEKAFPADFISEAIDQTRGWFYSLLAISTLLFEDKKLPHPYKNCIVLGLVLGKDGKKLSKRLRNYDEPGIILEREGADALRWYFYFGQPAWTSARFDETAVAEAQREFLIRLYNVYSFFVIYANIDKFNPNGEGPTGKSSYRPVSERCALDRWIIAELNRTILNTTKNMDELQIHPAATGLCDFVDAMSNWYVRRSRSRFWKSGADADKLDAYWTLYECLTTLSKIIAPFVPFFSETMYQNLVKGQFGGSVPESVHLCDWPEADEKLIDKTLLEQMSLVREIVAMGRSARAAEKLKVRQPLSEVELVLADAGKVEILQDYIDLMKEELNVKNVKFVTEAREYVDYIIKPNFKAIGPKFGKLAPAIKTTLAGIDGGKARQQLVTTGSFPLTVNGETISLSNEEVEIGLQAHAGFAAAQGQDVLVILKTEIDESLELEGMARDLIHQIQQLRKEKDLPYEARIDLVIDGPAEYAKVIETKADYIKNETLATAIKAGCGEGEPTKAFDLEGESFKIWMKIV